MIQRFQDIYIHAATYDEHRAEVSHVGRRSNSRPREMRGFRTCRVCTVYEPFQDMTEECCWGHAWCLPCPLPAPTTMVLALPPRPLRSDAPAEEKAVVRCLILEAVIIQQRLLDLSDTDAFLRAFRVASRLSTAVAAAIVATLMRMMRLE